MPSPVLPIVRELTPCPSPLDVARRLSHLPQLLVLDSSEYHPERGRYSYVMADPVATITDWSDLSPRSLPRIADLPPFQGGYAGLFGYGLGRKFEKIPAPKRDDLSTPELWVNRYEWVVAFDHQQNRSWFIAIGVNASSQIDEVRALIDRPFQKQHVGKLSDDPNRKPIGLESYRVRPNVYSNFSRTEYLAAVRRVIDYIHAGDVFQVNLSQRLLTPQRCPPLELFSRLREVSPAPYSCYFDAGDFQILSASPEQFLKVTDGEVVTRPIKGTRPRGRTSDDDRAQLHDLQTNPKDRAENVMIVDLLRNDLGRVCEFGSIRVPKVCEVESYNYVHHLVSEVRGRLCRDRTAFDLLRASFPGGSVTGAPKVRAMEIIAELEPTARGPYCGSIGYIADNGAMDSNILIRTFTASRGWLQFPVGGGIVADSDPVREYEETLHKAAGLFRAIDL